MGWENGQEEADVNIIQEGCQAIVDAIVVKRTRPGGQDAPRKCMLGLEEEAPKVEARNGDMGNHGLELRNACSQHAGQGSRWLG